MNRKVCKLLAVIIFVNLTTLAQAVKLSDDFNDNLMGTLWEKFGINNGADGLWFSAIGGPGQIHVTEINQRLEITASTQADKQTAVYGSTGWGVVTSEDFQIRVDFNHSKTSASFSSVFIGLIYDFEFLLFPSRWNYVNLFAGSDSNVQIFYYEQGGLSFPYYDDWKMRSSNTGNLYISYDTNLDELYLSDTGYGSVNAWKTISGLIRGQWNRQVIGVAIGGYSEGVALTSGEAYLDNFVIDSGTLCTEMPEADLNQDCKVDFIDFALMASRWLEDNSN